MVNQSHSPIQHINAAVCHLHSLICTITTMSAILELSELRQQLYKAESERCMVESNFFKYQSEVVSERCLLQMQIEQYKADYLKERNEKEQLKSKLLMCRQAYEILQRQVSST